jgi:ADP-ribose pyrophosphatase YjhB (NUDIX family)
MKTVLVLAKSQVKGYTRQDGVYVKPYSTKVMAKPKPQPTGLDAKFQQSGIATLLGNKPHQPGGTAFSYAQAALQAAKKLQGFYSSGQGAAKPSAGQVAPSKPKPIPKAYHPKVDEKGLPVGLYAPQQPSDAATWGDPQQVATFTPGSSSRPHALYGVALKRWADHPRTAFAWNQVAGQMPNLAEPPLPDPQGKHLSAGVVIEEEDGRVWTISPSNGFGGYTNTFPKGTLEDGINPQASAIKEAFEESGLQVKIIGYLADVERSTSVTRYYRAKRVGGDPTDMGWESQAVNLVPRKELVNHLKNKYDMPLVNALTGG